MTEMTERQARDWPAAIAEAQMYVDTSTIPDDLKRWEWTVRWEDESRPGRGQAFSAVYCDGEYLVQIGMDVYGGPRVSVGAVSWIHNGSDEECDCEPCQDERREDVDECPACDAPLSRCSPGEACCEDCNHGANWAPARVLCPECVQGKHGNCIVQTLNAADEWVPCGCPEHGEKP